MDDERKLAGESSLPITLSHVRNRSVKEVIIALRYFALYANVDH